MVAAFKAAARLGLNPVDFWKLTPYLTGLAVGGAVKKQTTDAWLNANLGRAKKLPELASLLDDVKEKKDNMDDFKNYLSSFGKGRK